MPATLPENMATIVRMELARRKMRQTELGALTGLARTTLSKRLLGEVPFTLAEIAVVAKALGMTPGELVDMAAGPAAQVAQPGTPRHHPVSPALKVERARKQKAAGPTSGPARRAAS
jgi:transcriptional regulator with XRE-family HTH domain